MPASDYSFATATELSAALAQKKVSAVELAQDVIARIEMHDGAINAVCVRDFDRGLAAAKAADDARARGESRPLLGIPMTVKESFNVAGLPTTWGFLPQKDFIATEDALAISRVKDAGAVILAKTNVPFGLADWQSYNDIYGTTNNPYDLTRTPGGSSGGSSAALAAGYGPLSLGSDIGGSLRAPAHFCGVAAHKPTYNLAPLRGHNVPPYPPLPFERDLSVIGPMARSAADCALLLDVIAGPDPIDMGVAYRLDLPPARHRALADFRVLVLDAHPLLPTGAEVREAITTLAGRLEKAGLKLARDSELLPDLTDSTRLYMRALLSFIGAAQPEEIWDDARRAVAAMPASEQSLVSHRLRGMAQTHREWISDNAARTRLRAQWRELFRSFDVVICPIMPTPAFPQDQSEPQELRRLVVDGAEHPYVDQLAWPGIATLPGLPATTIPVAMSREGLPIGVQIVGPFLEDRTPLQLAMLIERQWGGFTPPPAFA
jgi:amidase